VAGGYCVRVDTLFNMPGVHVLDAAWRDRGDALSAGLQLTVVSHSTETGCPGCGVIAVGHGRRLRRLHDILAFGAPVEFVWRQRRYRCVELACPVTGFSEDHPLAAARAKLTGRAVWWAIGCIQRDTASVQAVARRLGVDWHTVWDAIRPLLAELAGDPDRLVGVEVLGVDEHLWHHKPRLGKGPKELTGIVDLTRRDGRPQARLLDLVPGRSGKAYADWLNSRGEPFTAGVGIATLDPFRGYSNAIRDELEDATAVLDAFHVVRLGLKAMEETRRRVQQEQFGHRGRKHDPLYRIRNTLRAGAERLTAHQIERIEAGLEAGDPHFEVTIAWRCYQRLRSAFHSATLAEGRAIATKVIESFPSCPIPEIARLGRTLRSWKDQLLAYFTTDRANNGGTEAIQRHHRTPPSDRPRLPQPSQLQATDDLGRRATHPPKSPMSRLRSGRGCG
jgi:transposase